MSKGNFDKVEITSTLKTILLGTKFCALCLENNVDLYSLDSEVIIAWRGQTHSVRNVLCDILAMNYYKICSQYICIACKESAIRSYVFIHKTKENLSINSNYLEQLEKQVDNLTTNCDVDSIVLPILITLQHHKSKETKYGILQTQLEKPVVKTKQTIELSTVPSQKPFTVAQLPKVENYICDCCTKIFPNKGSLILHLNETKSLSNLKLYNGVYLKINGVMKCPFCKHNPCQHKKYLVSYKEQKEMKKDIINCPDCSYTCKTYRPLIEHSNRAHLNMQYNCIWCKLRFFSKYRYLKHKKVCGRFSVLVQCSFCKLTCPNAKSLEQHQLECGALNFLANKPETPNDQGTAEIINEDNKMVKRTEMLKSLPNGIIYPCGLCSSIFTNVKSLHLHKFRKHNCRTERDYMCSVCQVKCIGPRSLHEHLSTHSPEETHKCLSCSLEFEQRAQYVRHTHTRRHKYKTIPSWLYDINAGAKKFDCNKCDMEFDNPKLFCKHMSKQHLLEKVWCDICLLEFEPTAFLRHLRGREHKARAIPLREEIVHNLLDITCSVCEKKFYSPEACLIHFLKQHPNAKHKCQRCNLDFDDKTNYLEHVKTVHMLQKDQEPQIKKKRKPNEQNLKCKLCDFTTKNVNDLRAHKSKHPKKSCYCKLCGRKFTQVKTLNLHMRRHTGCLKQPKCKQQVCYVCGKVLCNTTSLKKHLRIHSGEKPYQCDICGIYFRGVSDCRLHKLKVHVGKIIPCPLCHRKFYAYTNLRSHIKRDHWKSKEKFDFRKLEGLTEADYDLFVDRRKVLAVNPSSLKTNLISENSKDLG